MSTLSKKIETAWFNLLSSSGNVRTFSDNTQEISFPEIVIKSSPVKPQYRGQNLYENELTIYITTYRDDDKDQTILDNLYETIQNVVYSVENSQLTALTNDIKFRGLIFNGGEINDDDNYQIRTIELTNKIQKIT